jgi:hypothetical protein
VIVNAHRLGLAPAIRASPLAPRRPSARFVLDPRAATPRRLTAMGFRGPFRADYDPDRRGSGTPPAPPRIWDASGTPVVFAQPLAIQALSRRPLFRGAMRLRSGVSGFQGYGDITDGLPDVAVDAAKQVITEYASAGVKIGATPSNIADDLLAAASGGIADSWFASEGDVASIANYKQLGSQILTWITVDAPLAAAGQKADGTPYTWNDWASFGNDLGSAAAEYANDAWDGDTFTSTLSALADAAKKTASTLGSPTLWPTWMKVGVGAGVVFAGAYLFNTFRPR